MSGETGEQLFEGRSRVRVRARTVRWRDAGQVSTHPLRTALREVERRFLASQVTRAAGPSRELLSEYLSLLEELGGLDEQIEEALGRRDVSYLVDRRLKLLNDYCLWLARRVGAEFLLVLQVYLEQELKRAIPPEAYQMFLRFQEVEDTAREIEVLSDDIFMTRLRDGTVFRDILHQIRREDVMTRLRQYGGASPEIDDLLG